MVLQPSRGMAVLGAVGISLLGIEIDFNFNGSCKESVLKKALKCGTPPNPKPSSRKPKEPSVPVEAMSDGPTTTPLIRGAAARNGCSDLGIFCVLKGRCILAPKKVNLLNSAPAETVRGSYSDSLYSPPLNPLPSDP